MPDNPLTIAPQSPTADDPNETLTVGGIAIPYSTLNRMSMDDRQKIFEKWKSENSSRSSGSDDFGPGLLQQGLNNPIMSRILSAGAAGGPQLAMGDIPGAAIGGGIGALLPAKSPADLATYTAGGFLGPAYGAAQQLPSTLMRMLASAGIGFGQEKMNQGIRSLAGQDPSGTTTGTAISTLLPMLGSGVQSLLGNKVNVQQAIERVTGGKAVGDLTATNPEQQGIVADLQQKYQEFSNSKSPQALAAVKKNMQDLQTQRDLLVTDPSVPQDPLKVSAMNKRLTTLAQQLPQSTSDPDAVSESSRLQQLLAQNKTLMARGLINRDVGNSNIDVIGKQLDALTTQITQGRIDTLRQASISHIDTNLTQLTDTATKLQSEITKNPFQNQMLRVFFNRDPNNPVDMNTFVKNVIAAPSENIDALYQSISNQFGQNGDAKIAQLRQAVLGKIMASGYDVKSNSFANLGQVLDPAGNLNNQKLVALFGGGVQGQQSAQGALQTIDDIRLIEQNSQKQSIPSYLGKSFGHAQIVALPTMLVMHGLGIHGYMAYGGAEAGSQILTIGMGKALDAFSQSPKLLKAFNDFAQGNPNISPVLTTWFKNNATPVEGFAPKDPASMPGAYGMPGQPPGPPQMMPQPGQGGPPQVPPPQGIGGGATQLPLPPQPK